MNNSMSPLRLMRVHTVSQRRREKTSVAGTSWNPFSFIHLYVFVCVMDYLLPPYFGRKALNSSSFFWRRFSALCMCLYAEHTNKIKPRKIRRAPGKGDDTSIPNEEVIATNLTTDFGLFKIRKYYKEKRRYSLAAFKLILDNKGLCVPDVMNIGNKDAKYSDQNSSHHP